MRNIDIIFCFYEIIIGLILKGIKFYRHDIHIRLYSKQRITGRRVKGFSPEYEYVSINFESMLYSSNNAYFS